MPDLVTITKMSYSLVEVSSKLQQGIALINTLNISIFQAILTQCKARNEESLTEELAKLSASTKLNQNDLKLLTLSLSHVLKQINQIIVKPVVLQTFLTEQLKLDLDKTEVLIKHWTEATQKSLNLENTKNLEDLSWDMNIQTASTFCKKEQQVKARIQMAFDKGNFTLELNEEELKQFYNVLEQTQKRMDNLLKAKSN